MPDTTTSINFDDILTTARVYTLRRSPFLGYTMLSANVVKSESVPIAAVDKYYMYINPAVFATFNIETQSTVLAHEVLHLALRHLPRRMWRDNNKWNIACDIIVNGILAANEYKVPDWSYTAKTLLEKYGVVLPPITDTSPEGIYPLIPDKAGEDMCDGASDLLGGNNSSDAAGDANSSDTDSSDAGKYIVPLDIDAHWKGVLSSAAEYAKLSSYGRLPAWLEREIGIVAPEVGWEAMLSMFVGTIMSDARSFARPARRHLWREAIMPSSAPHNLFLVVVIDTSASITEKELNKFAAELNAIIRTELASVTLIAHDAAVTDFIENVQNMSPLSNIRGGGGTLFYPVTEEIYSRGIFPDGVVWLTDGWGKYPEVMPPYPVLWALTSPHQKPPWGWQVVLDPVTTLRH